ncbi:MAG: Bcr/CflA family efflux MFS transporter [Alphaproteobacteria bacterium]|nr:Bcr/CflA family efflux MFS transporter [Alphaproteobacteria bacterium]
MTALPPAPRSGFQVNLLLTGLVAFQAISTDLYLASLPTLVRVFATDEARVQLTLSVFLLGSAVMQLAYGPISDRFGRRPVLRLAIALYVLASLACALAPTIEALILFRLLQAIGSCAGVTLGRAVARDLYAPTVAAKVLAYMASAMAIAPIIGPMLGSWMTVAFGWQANFLFLAGFGALCLVGLYTMLDETNLSPDPSAIAPKRIVANYAHLLGDRVFLGYACAVTLAYSGIFCFISGSSFTLIDVLGLPTELFGFCFGAAAAGYSAGALMAGRLIARFGIERMVATGTLLSAGFGLLGAALAWAGIASILAVLAPFIVVMIGIGFTLPAGIAGAIGPYPKMAGAAAAMVGFLQLGIAAGVGIGVGYVLDGTTRPMMTAVALVSLAGLASFRWLVLRAPRAAS